MSDEEAVKARADFEKKVLDEAPRLTREDSFAFGCHPGVSCFGDCCGDVNIVLTPYDVLRLKNRLDLTSEEFLEKHTVLPFSKDQRLPAPLLRMGDNEKESCLFLDLEKGGCTVYEDRPWACRMYPLGYAKSGEAEGRVDEFWFLMEEKDCQGFAETTTQNVGEWISGQGIEEYDEWGEKYRQLAVDDYLTTKTELTPQQMQMFYMGTYELDTFRRFVFKSTFLDRFEVSEEEQERLKTDDEALMEFGFRFLRFSLFGKPTMTIKAETIIPDAVQEPTP
jgi:Fe-S-cluster containining protein